MIVQRYTSSLFPLPKNPCQKDSRRRKLETNSSMRCQYWVSKNRLKVLDYEVRTLSYHRQEVLDEMISLRKAINPDMVFLPSSEESASRIIKPFSAKV